MLKRFFIVLSFFSFLSIAVKAYSDSNRFVFEQFPLNEKLSSNSVTRTFQDKEGYVWFGTKDGLCRFDGYDIKVFRSSASTPGKLTNNEIECITEDKNGRLWIGTLEGVNILDKKNYTVKPFINKFTDKERINSITCDSKGNIWIGTSNYGILKVNPENMEFERLSNDPYSRLRLKSNNISHIYEDKMGNIWISFWKNGLCFIDKVTHQINLLPSIGASNNPFRIIQDSDNRYWICTWGDGIYNMTIGSANKPTISPVKLSPSSRKIDNIVYSIVQDNKYGNIWIVTFSGLYLLEKTADSMYNLVDGKQYVGKTTGGIFHEIYKDRNGNLWLGTLGEGLYMLDLRNLPFENYPMNEIGNSINSFVTHLCQTASGNLYVALDRKGLFKFDISTRKILNLSNPKITALSSISAIINISGTNDIWIANEGTNKVYEFEEKNTILNLKRVFSLKNNDENSIRIFFEDKKKNVWIGTNSGLYKMTIDGKLEYIKLQLKFINTIGQDNEGNIWIGTEKNGLFVLKKGNSENEVYIAQRLDLNINNFKSHSIQSICSTPKDIIYVGTKEGCIYSINCRNIKEINEISGQYGITDEKILDILQDNYGNLWISTTKQIIRHNPTSHASTYYSTSNGLLINSFYKDARIKLKSGQILFGGNKGIGSFTPSMQQLTVNLQEQHVALTDILVQNNSIFEGPFNKLYDAGKNQITLKFNEKNLGIEFSVLDYISASNTQYAYKLSEVDNKWNYIGNNRRFVNYADLQEGTYTFMVKASDENGVWSDQVTTLTIKVLPPFYRTWWAYLLYLIGTLAIIYFIYRNFSNRIRLKNDLRISKIEKDKSEELVQTKLRYFTNITHELLTPLTIIMLEIEKLQRKLNDSPSQYSVIKDNVLRLRRLIEQILYFRKVESGNMKLKVSKGDIIVFIDRICRMNFKTLYDEKDVELSFSSSQSNYMAYFDPDKIDKIIYNLLSNAYKHTPAKGSVHVKAEIYKKDIYDFISLTVTDTGDGISEKDLPCIFDRFYITTTSDQSQSHGIGLALTNDLVKIHKGAIQVTSKLKEGTTFIFNIPISRDCYSEEEISEDIKETDSEPVKLNDGTTEDVVVDESAIGDAQKEFTLLIVEDNKELREIMRENFEKKYHVFTAENGLQAYELIQNIDADMIISDVMMPEMNGLTLCKLVKNDVKTSHISLLMLTARDSSQDRIDCYEAGADAYISKPFELAVLEARVKNLIYSRAQKILKFQHEHDVSITTMEYNSIDEEYIKTAISMVESRLADEAYDFEQFAIDMSSSKSTLHRKLKSLTGLSPWEFIRNIRLKHAAQMLKSNAGNISEVAFKVGFNDPKYFSRCFKTEFGMTPKEFQDKKE
ncbi:MAG: hybrid sensor histidine kinase/response regulator transcription factor [Paludibacteraceae bacterium]